MSSVCVQRRCPEPRVTWAGMPQSPAATVPFAAGLCAASAAHATVLLMLLTIVTTADAGVQTVLVNCYSKGDHVLSACDHGTIPITYEACGHVRLAWASDVAALCHSVHACQIGEHPIAGFQSCLMTTSKHCTMVGGSANALLGAMATIARRGACDDHHDAMGLLVPLMSTRLPLRALSLGPMVDGLQAAAPTWGASTR